MQQNLKIFVCYSFDTPILPELNNDIFVPVKCGGYQNDKIVYSDDSIDTNVSKYNKYINEMSMIYWLGKNQNIIDNLEYIGTAHYRRIFDIDYSNISLNENQIYVNAEKQFASIYKSYCVYHKQSDLDLFISEFINVFPDLHDIFMSYLNQNILFKCNMFIMHKNNFIKYYNFIEKCINICLLKLLPNIDLTPRDNYQQRALGFILERMTSFWYYMNILTDKNVFIQTQIKQFNFNTIYDR